MATAEGFADFEVPGLRTCRTWYKTVGDIRSAERTPLVVLHGGPGACHDYLLPLLDLDVPLVFYDQIGNGRSTHLRDEKYGDEKFWSLELFKSELNNLLRHLHLDDRPIDVLGHSWGGMLAAEWAVTRESSKLRGLIISNSMASVDAWRTGITRLRRRLPAQIQDTLENADITGDFDSVEYSAAIEVFYMRHLSLARPWPAPEVQSVLKWFAKDSTIYETMYGPSDLTINGSLRNWTVIPKLSKIKASTLLLNGAQDEAHDVAMQPFFKEIPKAKWITLDKAAHFSHVDQRDKYMEHIRSFLTELDAEARI